MQCHFCHLFINNLHCTSISLPPSFSLFVLLSIIVWHLISKRKKKDASVLNKLATLRRQICRPVYWQSLNFFCCSLQNTFCQLKLNMYTHIHSFNLWVDCDCVYTLGIRFKCMIFYYWQIILTLDANTKQKSAKYNNERTHSLTPTSLLVDDLCICGCECE